MRQVRMPEVDQVGAHARDVYSLAMKCDIGDREQWDQALNVAVDSFVESWEGLLTRLQELGRESAQQGETLSVEHLGLGGALIDIKAAATALDSARRNLQWTYSRRVPDVRPADTSDIHAVGFITLKRDFAEFLEQQSAVDRAGIGRPGSGSPRP